MKYPPYTTGFGPIINRFADVLDHTDKFAFSGRSRIAREVGVCRSTITRVLNHQVNPSFALVARITAAIEKEMGFRIDPRDLIAEEGQFLTRSVCDLMACPGCLPENALDEFGATTPGFKDIYVGRWVTSCYPNGFESEKGLQ